MKNQQGAALVIVMALLSGALLIGISGMNSALIDERLAGNYRSTALSQMNAERAASEAGIKFNDPSPWNGSPNDELSSETSWKDAIKSKSYEELSEDYKEGMVSQGVCGIGEESYNNCLYFPVYIDNPPAGPERYAVAIGAVENEEGRNVALSEPIFLRYGYSDQTAIDDFLEGLKNSGGVITTFEEVSFKSSGNAKAEGWEELIVNIDSNELFEDDESFLNFVEELKLAPSVNYFSSLSSKDLSDYNNSIVVVEEDFSWNGNNDFTGVLILLGKGGGNGSGFSYKGGGSGSFKGSILHIPYEVGEQGLIFLNPEINVSGGNGDLEFDENVIDGLKNGDSGGEGQFGIQEWEWE